jgi:hypothetical protein
MWNAVFALRHHQDGKILIDEERIQEQEWLSDMSYIALHTLGIWLLVNLEESKCQMSQWKMDAKSFNGDPRKPFTTLPAPTFDITLLSLFVCVVTGNVLTA